MSDKSVFASAELRYHSAKMIPIIHFALLLSLLLERLFKHYGPQSLIDLALTSIAILGMATYIIRSHTYTSQDKNWAYISIGIVLGLWLKNTRHKSTT
jgi:hypothetical protein